MDNPNNGELLSRYARANSEAAFAELVRRYAPLVYSAALRQTGAAEDARDITQEVFSTLARKANRLTESTVLAGWLYQSVRLQCLELRRNQRRRTHREVQATDMNAPELETPANWEAIRPVLDDAIAGLSEEDRDALLLRFFKNENLGAVGAALGVSEDAAQKRVSRALLRLREILVLRGITCAADALGAALNANAVETMPDGFGAVLTQSPAAQMGTTAARQGWNLAGAKSAAVVLTVALAVLALVHSRSLREINRLYAQLARQADEVAQLRADNERLSGLLADALLNQTHRAGDDTREIARLRARVAELRDSVARQKPVPAAPTNSPVTPVELPQLDIHAAFLTVPSKGPDFGESMSSLDEAEAAAEIAVATNDPDAVMVQTPNMVIGRAIQGHLSSENAVGYNGGVTNVGLSLDVLPEWNGPVLSKIELMIQATRVNQDSNIDLMTVTNEISGIIKSGTTVRVRHRLPEPGPWFAADPASPDALRDLEVFVTFVLVDSAGNRIPPASAAATPAPDVTVSNHSEDQAGR